MTRSDLLLALAKYEGDEPLVDVMFNKIENVYIILFAMEKHEEFKELAGLFRKALESSAALTPIQFK